MYSNYDHLLQNILQKIKKEKRLLALKRRLALFSCCIILSGLSLIPVLRLVMLELTKSGFSQFLSLIFSDFKIVALYWQNFIMSLLETIPVISLALLCLVIFVFLYFIRLWIKDLELIFGSKPLITN